MSWTYKNNEINDITQFPDNTYGFVYINRHKPSGKAYIGKKILQFKCCSHSCFKKKIS